MPTNKQYNFNLFPLNSLSLLAIISNQTSFGFQLLYYFFTEMVKLKLHCVIEESFYGKALLWIILVHTDCRKFLSRLMFDET
jgi:hypothetical protein